MPDPLSARHAPTWAYFWRALLQPVFLIVGGAFTLAWWVAGSHFWLIVLGAWVFLYLARIPYSPRFRQAVDEERLSFSDRESLRQLRRLWNTLGRSERLRIDALQELVKEIESALRLAPTGDSDVFLSEQQERVGGFVVIALRLLAARMQVASLLHAESEAEIRRSLERLEKELARTDLPEDLRTSRTKHAEDLRGRLDTLTKAQERLAYLDAELERVEDRLKLIRGQALLQRDPAQLSAQVDAVTEELQATERWMADLVAETGGTPWTEAIPSQAALRLLNRR